MTSWILLRGLTRETRHWGDFPDTLQAALPDADITAIDLPGNGARHELRSPTSIEAIAADCRGQALASGLRPPFKLLAMSLGGMVAVAWASAHPDEIARLCADQHQPAPVQSVPPAAAPRQLRRPAAGSPCHSTTAPMKPWCWRSPAAAPPTWPACWRTGLAWRREHPVSLANALRQLTAAARYQAPRQRPIEHLLILAGSRTRWSIRAARDDWPPPGEPPTPNIRPPATTCRSTTAHGSRIKYAAGS